MIDVKKCWAALYSNTHCNENTCEECKSKYLDGRVDAIGCPMDAYKDEMEQLTQVLEKLMNAKDQATSEEFANLLFEGELNV